ncbi:MAG: hypothetical protein A2033_11235 [Bacteroidetes bacterium GWA2_31_9]|nr:MAG: hypothetical protein A2033_11235 [Bacteroidetes bacterium GWA2_31_9]
MKYVTLIFGLYYSINCFGQSTNAISLDLSPMYSYRYFTSNENGNIKNKFIYYDSKDFRNLLDTTEYAVFGYSIGFNFTHSLKKFNIIIGINYSKTGESNKLDLNKGHQYYYNGQLISSYDGTEEFNFKNYYHHLNVPLSLSYRVFDKSLKIYVRIGSVFSYVLYRNVLKPKNYEELLTKPILKEYYASYNKFIFGLSGSIRIEKYINDKISVGIEPIINVQMTPILTIENELKQHNYNSGLIISIVKHLK